MTVVATSKNKHSKSFKTCFVTLRHKTDIFPEQEIPHMLGDFLTLSWENLQNSTRVAAGLIHSFVFVKYCIYSNKMLFCCKIYADVRT